MYEEAKGSGWHCFWQSGANYTIKAAVAVAPYIFTSMRVDISGDGPSHPVPRYYKTSNQTDNKIQFSHDFVISRQ
ncbi:hypothetical protein [Piscirickettsia litoralis]|uniref:Uncharacterized protein n=1 Tax=Piscirickettsia litoralis TaxID=1891921 RepID=A0ABX3A358_9GAMM|nr:hypothetical protein [Piscirickettsia litoralis]ODN43309.1 hypothetical protein BGC07_10725 [Piscirickettsia litoralis]